MAAVSTCASSFSSNVHFLTPTAGALLYVTPTACYLQEQIDYANICSGTEYGNLIGPGGVTLATQFPSPAAVGADEVVDIDWLLPDNAGFPGSSLTDGVYTQLHTIGFDEGGSYVYSGLFTVTTGPVVVDVESTSTTTITDTVTSTATTTVTVNSPTTVTKASVTKTIATDTVCATKTITLTDTVTKTPPPATKTLDKCVTVTETISCVNTPNHKLARDNLEVIDKRQQNDVCTFSAPPTVTVTTGTTIVTDTATATITDTVTCTSTCFDTITVTCGTTCVGPVTTTKTDKVTTTTTTTDFGCRSTVTESDTVTLTTRIKKPGLTCCGAQPPPPAPPATPTTPCDHPKPKPMVTVVPCEGGGYTTSTWYPEPAATSPAQAAVVESPAAANTTTTSPTGSVLSTWTSGAGRAQIAYTSVFVLAAVAAFWL